MWTASYMIRPVTHCKEGCPSKPTARTVGEPTAPCFSTRGLFLSKMSWQNSLDKRCSLLNNRSHEQLFRSVDRTMLHDSSPYNYHPENIPPRSA